MTATSTIKCNFTNQQGLALDARLDIPRDHPPRAYVVISHCFTCSKDMLTSFRVSRGLAQRGLGALRFDFTGLGDSAGDFADTNFSTMMDDILSACAFLTQNYAAPIALVGHSMGGTASLLASRDITSCKAVVTLASPSQPAHVLHHFGPAMDALHAGRASMITVAGVDYPVTPQFVLDVEHFDMSRLMEGFGKSILVVKAGRDQLVPEQDADQILQFGSGANRLFELDNADHLFSDRQDTESICEQIIQFLEQ